MVNNIPTSHLTPYQAYQIVKQNFSPVATMVDPDVIQGNINNRSENGVFFERPETGVYGKPKFRSMFAVSDDPKEVLKNGIFSTFLNDIIAAIDAGADMGKFVDSEEIPLGYYKGYGPDTAPTLKLGKIDALTYHCYRGNVDVVTRMLKALFPDEEKASAKYKFSKKYPGLNPLTAAVLSGQIDMIRLLMFNENRSIREGVAKLVNSCDGFGNSPLQYSASLGGLLDPYELTVLLIKGGADGKVVAKKGDDSALIIAVQRDNMAGHAIKRSPHMIAALLRVSDLDYKNGYGLTARDVALRLNNKEVVDMIDAYRNAIAKGNVAAAGDTFNRDETVI
jgi:hypothetical protein